VAVLLEKSEPWGLARKLGGGFEHEAGPSEAQRVQSQGISPGTYILLLPSTCQGPKPTGDEMKKACPSLPGTTNFLISQFTNSGCHNPQKCYVTQKVFP
jgi:hypothetical protein